MTIVLGLTGGIASGKSTADAFFHKNKIPVIDSDSIAHDILNVGQKGHDAVIRQFGVNFLNSDETINRTKLGQLVFSDKHKLKILNSITHPLIFQEIEDKITQNKLSKTPLIIVDVPLLFESGIQNYCDRTLLIALPKKIQVKRLMKRDHLSENAALERINSQMPLAQKKKLANYVVENTGTIEELEGKLQKLLLKIKEEDQYGMS